MTTMASLATARVREQLPPIHRVPLSRMIGVELRKMFDTRSGLWLMASILITALLSTVAMILFAADADLTHYTFSQAIGYPMTVILPIIAILSITGEWSQRSGLTTFTLVPHRGRIILAKVIASVGVGAVAMLVALVCGVLGNVVGTAIAGTDLVWDVSVGHFLTIVLGSLLCLLTGTMLGILFRSSTVALVTYFVYAFLLPTVFSLLASRQQGFAEQQPWLDLNLARAPLFEGSLTVDQWAHLAVTTTAWIILPALIGLRLVMRSEVK